MHDGAHISHRQKIARGFTLLELLFAVGIFSLITLAMVDIFVNGFRWNRVVYDQLSGAGDARRAVSSVTDDARRAAQSNIGSYAIESARDNEFIFFSNIDNDANRERVRYTLVGSTLKKGVVKPGGSPLKYTTSTESVIDVAHDVKNASLGVPVFLYYGDDYTGSGSALVTPASTTRISAVKVQIDIDHNPDRSPETIHADGFVTLRNVN